MTPSERLDSGDTFTHRGHEFKVILQHDDWIGNPWDEFDYHGLISEWTRRGKGPGERILVKDRHGMIRYYDVAGTMPIARRHGWSCTHPEHTTAGQRAACAVDQDYEYLRAWCNDDWQYVDLVVVLEGDSNTAESIGGVEYGLPIHDAHISELARELADQILAVVEVEHPNALLSEN